GYGKLYMFFLIDLYQNDPDKEHFFTDFFDKLAGTDQLRKNIMDGKPEGEIRSFWKEDLDNFMQVRKKYLLYPDFSLIISNKRK
ncbi:MAG: hypothetical protein ACHQK8_07670, partial [Bacteroidia bacterium]